MTSTTLTPESQLLPAPAMPGPARPAAAQHGGHKAALRAHHVTGGAPDHVTRTGPPQRPRVRHVLGVGSPAPRGHVPGAGSGELSVRADPGKVAAAAAAPPVPRGPRTRPHRLPPPPPACPASPPPAHPAQLRPVPRGRL